MWLKSKIDRIIEKYDSYTVLDRAMNIESSMNQEEVKEARIRTAINIISEYLDNDWRLKLFEEYGYLHEKFLIISIPVESEIENKLNYFKAIPKEEKENQPKETEKKKQKLSAAQQKLLKTNTKGMKKLDSFFTKKPSTK
jgi:hypothetical protein